jgi:hypothetical protein
LGRPSFISPGENRKTEKARLEFSLTCNYYFHFYIVTKFRPFIYSTSRAPLATLCLILAFCVMASNVRAQAKAPELIIDSVRRDFGDVFAGEELEQVFIIRNAGDAPLELAEKSTTTGSNLPRSRDFIRASSFNRGQQYLLPVAALRRRAAPS